MKKVLFVDKSHKILKNKLLENNFICDDFTGNSYNDLYDIIDNYFGIIIRSKFIIDKKIIDKAVNLRFIGRVGAGMESIDVDYAESKNIICLNSPEGSRTAVGEHALALLLNLFNNITVANNETKNLTWNREKNRGIEIEGKTIGIIGYGNMGSSFAKKLSGFDCKIISYDKYKKKYSDKYTTEVDLKTLKEFSDVISLHVPLTTETKNMIDTNFINSVKKPFFLINTSRGQVVKTSDLITALQNKKISGAGLDVLEYENTSFETIDFNHNLRYLLNADNVIITPHIAGWTHESKIKLAEVLANKIINLFNS